jgi:hypothetical protein
MKTCACVTVYLTILGAVSPSWAQGDFQNLDFESGRLVPVPNDPNKRFYFAEAFPGWAGYVGENQITEIFYNTTPITAASISLMGRDAPFGNRVLEGQYNAYLHAGALTFTSFVDTSIAQVGLVPRDSRYLLFNAYGIEFSVSLAGQNIPIFALGGGPNNTLYGGDISAFAGQIGELRFTSRITPQPAFNTFSLDSIRFSPVPEPSTWALLGVGALALGYRLHRRAS